MDDSRFQPIRHGTDRKTLRSQQVRHRDDSEVGHSASHKYSSGGLPPSSSNNNSNTKYKLPPSDAASINGRRLHSGLHDDKLSRANTGDVPAGSNSNHSIDNDEDGYHQPNHNYLHYNDRLSKARNSVDESAESMGSDRRSSFLNRRSSSVMRVRELRDVLNSMTSSQGDEEQEMKGSQKAQLLVASQQRLMSRLQDLSHQLDSIDNEVTRVKGDIISSRRYFSAMTGIPYGPEWTTTRQMDSAYTSPTSCLSPGSSDDSPCPSDIDWPHAPTLGSSSSPRSEVEAHGRDLRLHRYDHRRHSPETDVNYPHRSRSARPQHKVSRSETTNEKGCGNPGPNPTIAINNRLHRRSSSPSEYNGYRHMNHLHPEHAESNTCYSHDMRGSGGDRLQQKFDRLAHLESPFRSLADFDQLGHSEGRESVGLMSGGPLLTRSDSCSSFMSWRSDQEMAGLFPDEVETSSSDISTRFGGK